MSDRPEPVLSTTVHACHRTYFIDIERDSKGEPFLVINESKRVADAEFERHKIIVAAEHVPSFFLALRTTLFRGGLLEPAALEKATEFEPLTTQEHHSTGNHNEPFREIREDYPNAYRTWTADDDQKLKDAFRTCQEIKVLSDTFQRKPGAITARLRKLGLRS
jgi:hypothetical protein